MKLRFWRKDPPDIQPMLDDIARDVRTDQLYEELSFGRRTSDKPVILPCLYRDGFGDDHPAEVHRHPGSPNLYRRREVLDL